MLCGSRYNVPQLLSLAEVEPVPVMPLPISVPWKFVVIAVEATGSSFTDGHRMKSLALIQFIDGRPVADAYICTEVSRSGSFAKVTLTPENCRHILDFIGSDTIVCYDAEHDVSFLNLELVSASADTVRSPIVSIVDLLRQNGRPVPADIGSLAKELGISLTGGGRFTKVRLAASVYLTLAGKPVPAFIPVTPSAGPNPAPNSRPEAAPRADPKPAPSPAPKPQPKPAAPAPTGVQPPKQPLPTLDLPKPKPPKTNYAFGLASFGCIALILLASNWQSWFKSSTEKAAPVPTQSVAVPAAEQPSVPDPVAQKQTTPAVSLPANAHAIPGGWECDSGYFSFRTDDGKEVCLNSNFWRFDQKPADLNAWSSPKLEHAVWCYTQNRALNSADRHLRDQGIDSLIILQETRDQIRTACWDKSYYPSDLFKNASLIVDRYSVQIDSWGKEFADQLVKEYRQRFPWKDISFNTLTSSNQTDDQPKQVSCRKDSILLDGTCVKKDFWRHKPAVSAVKQLDIGTYLWCESRRKLISFVQTRIKEVEPDAGVQVIGELLAWDQVCARHTYHTSYQDPVSKLLDKYRYSISSDAVALADRFVRDWRTDRMRDYVRSSDSFASHPKRIVRIVQGFLNAEGYDAGTADGIVGEKTRRAIDAYTRDHPVNTPEKQLMVSILLGSNE